MEGSTQLNVPEPLRRSAHRTEEGWTESARRSLALLCQVRGVPDLGSTSVLDVGCGTKLVKVLVEENRPIGRYVGVDVSREVIGLLCASVADPRFEFHYLDVRNELYNPKGTPLTEYGSLPIGDDRFDLICLFSVFTHLAPDDFSAMLRVLRTHAGPGCRLLFSLYINTATTAYDAYDAIRGRESVERTEREMKRRLEAGDPDLARRIAEYDAEHPRSRETQTSAAVPDFLDVLPEKPLLIAAYSEPFARSLVEQSGWHVLSLNPPEGYIQHYFVCEPSQVEQHVSST